MKKVEPQEGERKKERLSGMQATKNEKRLGGMQATEILKPEKPEFLKAEFLEAKFKN